MGPKRKVTKSAAKAPGVDAGRTRKKIMVVDDDKDFLEEIREILSARGYEAIMADSGDTALKSARSCRPDIILLDIVMSEMNGFQVADKLNKWPETAKIPIIAITGWFIREQHQKLVSMLGIKAILMKPLEPIEMISCIENVLKGRILKGEIV